MEGKTAADILARNCEAKPESLLYELHEKNRFSARQFWALYDALLALAEDARTTGRQIETAGRIAFICQQVLKEFLYHLDQQDGSQLAGFPQDYGGYIERLEYAQDAWFRGVSIDENLFGLKRPDGEIPDD